MPHRTLILFGMALLVLALLSVGLGVDTRALPSPMVGKAMPAFSQPSLQDPNAQLTQADFLGRPALINVWASWCSSCRAEKPLLLELAAAGVVLYGFNYKDSRDAALRTLATSGDPYQLVLFDPQGEAGLDWGVYATPETYLIDAQGMIRHKHIGPLTPQVVQEQILPLLARLETDS